MTVSLLSSLSWKKKNPTILIKQSKSTSCGEQQQSPQHLKMKRRFKNKKIFGSIKTVHRFCNDSDLVHLNAEELLYSMETKVKVKVVIVYPNSLFAGYANMTSCDLISCKVDKLTRFLCLRHFEARYSVYLIYF